MYCETLKVLRAVFGLTQAALAHLAGCSRKTIIRIEKGYTIRFDLALLITNILNGLLADYFPHLPPLCTCTVQWSVCDARGMPLSKEEYCIGLCGASPQALTLLGVIRASGTTPLQVAQSSHLDISTVYKAESHSVRPATRKKIIAALNTIRVSHGREPLPSVSVPIKITQRRHRGYVHLKEALLQRLGA